GSFLKNAIANLSGGTRRGRSGEARKGIRGSPPGHPPGKLQLQYHWNDSAPTATTHVRGCWRYTALMRLSFYGGAGKVTGSNFLIEGEQGKILVDCGLEQGAD